MTTQCCTTALQAALKANPTFAEAYSNLGNAYKELQRYTEAIDSYNQVGIAATRAEVSIPLALARMYTLPHTTHHTPQAIKLDPEFADAYGNLAAAYKDIGKLNTAIEVYLKALKLKPQQANGLPDPIIFCNLMHCLQIVCEWKGRDEVFATTKSIVDSQLADGRLPAVQPHHALVYPLPTDTQLAIAKRVRSPHTSLPACLNQRKLLTLATPSLQYAKEALDRVLAAGLKPYDHDPATAGTATEVVPADEGKPPARLRVGYLSSDIGDHPLCHLMGRALCWHNPQRFEVFVYATNPVEDSTLWRTRVANGVTDCTGIL